MKCVICKHGETNPDIATVVLERGITTVIIRETPADVCKNCGEYYLNEETTERVLQMAYQAVIHNVEVEFIRFAA